MYGMLLRGFFLKLIGTVVAVLVLSAGVSGAADVRLQWDPNTESTLKGYKIYYKTGTSGPPYDGSGASQGSSPVTVPLTSIADAAHPEFTLLNLNDGQTYFIAITAYSDTAESGYSNEVIYSPPSSSNVIDNGGAAFAGTWSISTKYPGYYGSNYQWVGAGSGTKTATWTYQAGSAGQYRISAWWSADAGRPPDAPYTIYNNGTKLGTVRVNQRINGGQFNELGTYQISAGSVSVVLSDDISSGYVVADAVQFEDTGGGAPVDSDGDGLSDQDETAIYGSDPDVADTDGDGMDDGDELQYWGSAWNQDGDSDGKINLLDNDSDNDGYADGEEVNGGFDPSDPNSKPLSAPTGGVIDNLDAGFTTVGTWSVSTRRPGYYDSNYQWVGVGSGAKTATWTFQVDSAGQYRISAWWSAYSDRPTDAPYTVYNNGVKLGTVRVDQRIDGGQFNELGTYQLNAGTVEVVLSDDISSGYVIADAVELEPVSNPSPPGNVNIDNLDAGFTTVGTWSVSARYPGYYGDNYQWVGAGTGAKTATWTFQVGSAGQYRISAWWSAYSNRPPDAPYTIYNNGVRLDTVAVDQRVDGEQFNELGTYQLNAGTVEVVLSDDISSGYVIADAVSLEAQ